MKKKLLSVLVAVALGCSLFSAVPIVSQAEELTSGDWTYSFYDDFDCTITKYNGSDKNVVIPSELNGKTVLGIGFEAFYGNKDITSVTIPDTVQGIKESAFRGCTELANVDLGHGVSYLGEGCFCECDSLTSIVIPASMTQLGVEGFNSPFSDWPQSNDSLRTVTFESGGVKIPDTLFLHCHALKSVKIPEGITEIGNGVFSECKSLEEITIPDSVQNIEFGAFENCAALKEITLPNSLKAIEASTFYGCRSLEMITIPDSVQAIGTDAFRECESLKEIILPTSVKSIGLCAFAECSSLVDFYDYNESTEYLDEDEVTTYEYNEELGEWEVVSVEKVPAPIFRNVPTLTIHGYPGSNAEKYAKKNSIKFASLTGGDPDDPGSNPDDPGSDPGDPETPVVEGSMYRLYNPNSGEHFYTSNATEKNNLVSAGWTSEGSAWIAPTSSNAPVYRVYNPNSGEHHYTMNAGEKDFLVGLGWNDEGIGWYSDDNQGTPLYRLYNPNATGQYEAGGHHYTKDVNEKNILIANGWRDEGIGWYGV